MSEPLATKQHLAFTF